MPLRRSASPCLALLLAAAGCTGERPAEGAIPPSATPVGAAPSDPPRADPPAPDPPAPASRIRSELGDTAVAVVERADTAGAARMKVIGALQAEQATLTSDDRIGGYPIEAPLVQLDADARARLLRLILDDASYDHETARRCANDYFVGVRFQRAADRVEFNLGVRCMQAFWSVRDGDDVRRAGALLTDPAGEAVLKLLAGAGVRGALK